MSMARHLRKAARIPRPRGRVDLSHPVRSPLGSAVVNCVAYVDGVRQDNEHPAASASEAVKRVREAGEGFVWIGLHEPEEREFSEISGLLGLHPLAVEHAVQGHQRPKVEKYDGMLLTVLKTVRYCEHDELTSTSEVVDTGEVMVFLGPDYVITVRHGGHGSLGPIREALETRPEQLATGPSAVLHAIADQIVDDYVAVADCFQDDLDRVESEVFARESVTGADPGRIYQLKRELLELKRAVAPLDRPLHTLAEEPLSLVSPEIQKYFRDVADHLALVTEQVASFDELLNSILQANLAQMSVAQNESMRKITAWAAIVAVPTMVCGVYGMNFEHMPELHSRFGYPLAMSVIVLVCAALYRGFRRNDWL